jgi:Peptidase propeptide and YPEB domain
MYQRAMNPRTLLVAGAVALLLLVGAGVAYATGGDSSDEQSTGPGMEKAKSIALDQVKGGRVTGTELNDEEGYYEVEVTRDDGSQVDVHLDRNFNVLDTPADHEGSDSQDGSGDGGNADDSVS